MYKVEIDHGKRLFGHNQSGGVCEINNYIGDETVNMTLSQGSSYDRGVGTSIGSCKEVRAKRPPLSRHTGHGYQMR